MEVDSKATLKLKDSDKLPVVAIEINSEARVSAVLITSLDFHDEQVCIESFTKV